MRGAITLIRRQGVPPIGLDKIFRDTSALGINNAQVHLGLCMSLLSQWPKFLYSSVVVTTTPRLHPNLKVSAFGQSHPQEMCSARGKAEPWNGHKEE